jgi:O-antigen/teichoic acid export membrane protein
MSRFRRVVHSVASGYFVLAEAALYSFALFPLGLHYLSKERLGLWFLMTSIASQLSQIDLGMSGSLGRLLIDHKDDREGSTYGSMIQTGWLVLIVQGCLVAFVGFALAPLFAPLFRVETALRPEFISLMRWQTVTLGLSFSTKIFGHLLQAHQRNDIVNYGQMFNLLLSFGLIWQFFRLGCGVLSLAWASLIVAVVGNLLLFLACRHLRLFPSPGRWGRPAWTLFKTIFGYGKDIFLVAVGAQLIMASQPMIISRQLGLATVTTWYAGLRVFNFLSQVIWRPSDVSMPAFSEMMVRGENNLLKERYKSILILTASFSGFAAISFALCNSLFVGLWTSLAKKSPVIWPPNRDGWLGLWMIILAISHCHTIFILYTKRVGFMRYVYFVEGVIFVLLALLASKRYGLSGIILSSIVCSLCFSGGYGVWRASSYFDLPLTTVAFRWLLPLGRVLLGFGPIALITWFASRNIADPMIRLGLHVLISASLGFAIFLRFGVPPALQHELLHRTPGALKPILSRFFGSP